MYLLKDAANLAEFTSLKKIYMDPIFLQLEEKSFFIAKCHNLEIECEESFDKDKAEDLASYEVRISAIFT